MSTEIAVQKEDGLLAMAIEKGVDTETLSKLLALRNSELERQAKARFAEEFAKMQAEFRPVGKSKTANDYNGKRLYSYCPIEDILAMAAPVMARHGFSYRWTEEALENREKRINCIVSGYGHSETSFVDIPFMDPVSKATNVVQMRGSATTYGKRYSFLNATGIIVGGEDDDAQGSARPREAQEGHQEPREEPSEPEDPSEPIRDGIRAAVAEMVQILQGTGWSDAERAGMRTKVAVAKGATPDTLAYVQSLLKEYRAKDAEKRNPVIDTTARPEGSTVAATKIGKAVQEELY